MIRSKIVTIQDIGRNLTPIGYSFKSPILTPSVFNMEYIGRFIFENGCTAMFEHYEGDTSYKVKLDAGNFTKDFAEIWAEQFPTIPFPYGRDIEIVDTDAEELHQVVTDSDIVTPDINVNGVADTTPVTEIPVDTTQVVDSTVESVDTVITDETIAAKTPVVDSTVNAIKRPRVSNK